MGFYIEAPSHILKAEFLIDKHQAKLLIAPEYIDPLSGSIVVCVVRNPLFEAAAIVFDTREFDDFNDPEDDRSKTWLKLPTSEVVKLNPHVEKVWKTQLN